MKIVSNDWRRHRKGGGSRLKRIARIPLYIALLFIIGLISGHLTFMLLSFSKTVEVPDLKGKSMIEASDIIRSNGLYIRLDGEDHDLHVPQGFIARQDVPAGSSVKEGREIRVMLSLGPRVKYVPDVVGQPIDTAEAMIRERGIKIKRIIYAHSGEDKNTVIAQRPEPHERGGDVFTVVVSLGNFESSGQ